MTSTRTPRPALSDVCREVIADLATQAGTPGVDRILAVTRRHVGPRDTIPAQVRTQVVAGVAANYFRLYAPGPEWRFTCRDGNLHAASSTLTWTHQDGSVIADTVLAEERPSHGARVAAARRLAARTAETLGPNVQLRVLVPRSPELSCLVRGHASG